MTKQDENVETVKAELVVTESVQALTPMHLIEKAMSVEGGIDIDKMTALFELNLKHEENESKKAFHKAVAAFKAESIDIIKTKHVSFNTSKGTTAYNHAELGVVMLIVTPLMSKHGLSHHWEYDQPEGQVKVTCILTHELGYSKSTSLQSGKDDSGGKNTIQAIASATSYLERYTFFAITGLASREKNDDDGAASEEPAYEPINEEEYANIEALINETKANVKGFCTNFKIKDVAYLPKDKYSKAISMLEAKRSAK